MKKVFLLLAVVGLAFASCEPFGPNGGNENEGTENVLGAAEFNISVSDVNETGATVKIAPKQEGRTFYWNIATEAALKEFASTAAYMQDYYDYLKTEAIDTGFYTWADLLDSKDVEYTSTKLNPATKYVVWAFGIDVNGNLTSADLSYVTFETKASTFGPTTWYGYWNVTAPKHVSDGVDPFTNKSVTELVNEPLEKVIAITDASADFGEGYVYVWGWDGVFELEMPALGLVSSNNIKLMNNTVLFTEDDPDYGPLDYTWTGMSDLTATHGGWFTIGGNYAAYTLTYTADNAATIQAYQGSLTDGTDFMTDYYCLAAVITTGQYAGYSLSFSRTDGQAALYLSGAEMTASYLAPVEGAAAQKLNANKKFRVAHKNATPRAAVKMFSSIAK